MNFVTSNRDAIMIYFTHAFTNREVFNVPISYNKLLSIFEEKGITSYTIKKEKVVGQSAWKKIHENGHIDTRTIESLCKYLNCQPGDILEYIPDDESSRSATE